MDWTCVWITKLFSGQDCLKNLGILIDSQLNFNAYVNTLLRSPVAKLKSLNNVKNLLPTHIKLTLTNLDNCDYVYRPCLTANNILRLQQIQNVCLRYSFNLPRSQSVTGCMADVGWFCLHDKFVLHLCNLTHKIITTGEPSYLMTKLIYARDFHDKNTRFCNNLAIPNHSTELLKACFSYQATKLHNSIPAHYKSLNLKKFKITIKEM